MTAPELRPYIVNSGLLHMGLLAVLLPLKSRAPAFTPSYTIDFVGPPVSFPSAAPPSSKAPAPSPKLSNIAPARTATSPAKRRRIALPTPSLLDLPRPGAPARPAPAPSETPAPTAPASVPAAQPSLTTDVHFPSPWYLTRLRALLWNSWAKDRPSSSGSATVAFILLRDGRVTDLRIEASSGDSAFDLAAQGAVADGEPYPPLPPEFHEPFLKIHATMSSQ